MSRDFLLTDAEGFLFLLLILRNAANIRLIGNAVYHFKRRDNLVLRLLPRADNCFAAFHAASRFHDNPVAQLDIQIARRKIINLARLLEADTDNRLHKNLLNLSSICLNGSPLTE